MLVVALTSLTGLACNTLLVPALAGDVLRTGSRGYSRLLAGGGIGALQQSTSNAFLQTAAPADLRGRVASLYGVDAIIEVDAAANARDYGELLKFGGDAIIHGSGAGLIEVPFRAAIIGFANLRFFIAYSLPLQVRRAAIEVLSPLLERGALQQPSLEISALREIAKAHERVESGAHTKVILDLRR